LLKESVKRLVGDAFREARSTILFSAVTHLFIFFLLDFMKFTVETRPDNHGLPRKIMVVQGTRCKVQVTRRKGKGSRVEAKA
jgi:hypothetical protein